jgi:hypothetical protein
MRFTPRYVLGFLIAWLTVLPLPGLGQTTTSHAPPNTGHTKRIEGTVTRVDGNEFLLQAKGGTTETYQLSPAVQIVRSRPGRLSDLSPGKFVGCTNLYGQSTQKVVAGDCHIFPEGIQGFAEDHGDAESPANSETNGTITDVRDDAGAAQGKGQGAVIQISHQGASTAMPVSSVTVITVLSVGDASALKPGAKVRGMSQQAVDGTGVIQWLTVLAADSNQAVPK